MQTQIVPPFERRIPYALTEPEVVAMYYIDTGAHVKVLQEDGVDLQVLMCMLGQGLVAVDSTGWLRTTPYGEVAWNLTDCKDIIRRLQK